MHIAFRERSTIFGTSLRQRGYRGGCDVTRIRKSVRRIFD
jgi:hypothetical protein